MSRFGRLGSDQKKKIFLEGEGGMPYVDWKDVESLRRLMSPNGKIHARKKLGTSAREQRLVTQAIKRSRFMSLLPYTSATL